MGTEEAAKGAGTGGLVECGGLRMDPTANSVTFDGRPLSLTPSEMRVLTILAAHCGRAVLPETIAQSLGDGTRSVRPQSVVGHVHTLRRKLGRDAIETIRGHGLRLKP